MKTKSLSKMVPVFLGILSLVLISNTKAVAAMIKEKTVTYMTEGIRMKGFVAWDESIKGKRPVVLVVPEWWGLNDYIRMRVRKLASLGYLAMAVDMYGDGKVAADPKEAQALTGPFYKDPSLAKARLDAAMKVISSYPEADADNMAAIGYCFGGYIVLNSAKLGADLKGVVSFHGGLGGAPVDKAQLKAKILVCHGGADKFVSESDVASLRKKLDSIGADATFKIYPNATHAFTNPDATKIGKQFNLPIEYNAEADRDSWNDMQVFFKRIFTGKTG